MHALAAESANSQVHDDPVADCLFETGLAELLGSVGEDPDRDGLAETPARVARAFREMTAGYRDDPAAILSRTFKVTHDEMIVLSDIAFVSLCEHHLLPFAGTAAVGYVPGKVVGVSKLARLVNCFARRLQIQERMTDQIADAVAVHLAAQGVGVVVRATHCCMSCRGVQQPHCVMTTCALRGVMRTDPMARSEFLSFRDRN